MRDIFDAIDDNLPQFIQKSAKQTYIIELSAASLLFLAQATHIYMMANPNSEMAQNALKEMHNQSDLVYNFPKQHGVYPSELTMPPHAKLFPQVVYVPVDYG